MNNLRKYIIPVLSILIVITVIITTGQKQLMFHSVISQYKLKTKLMYNDFESELVNNGTILNNVKLVCNDSVQSLKKIIKSPTLIVFIPPSTEACMSCVNCAIEELKNNLPNYNSNNVIILNASSRNIPARVYNKKIYTWSNKGEGLGIPADKSHMPHYFLINKELVVSNFYTPQCTNPEFTQMYIASVVRFQKKNSVSLTFK